MKQVQKLQEIIAEPTSLSKLGIAGLKKAYDKKLEAVVEFSKLVDSKESGLEFIFTIQNFPFFQNSVAVEKALLYCLNHPEIDPQTCASAAIGLLRHQPLSSKNKLFLSLMQNCVIPDEKIEKFLTEERRKILMNVPEKDLAWIPYLSKQCELNESAFYLSKEEKSLLNTTSEEIRACYLVKNNLPQLDPDDKVNSIQDLTSQKVQQQYEEHPYPRWIRVNKLNQESSENLHILIAGCGTGKHAIETALQYPESKIIALDLSLSSLSYGKQKANEISVTNIEFVQGDLLDLHELEHTFDLIFCTGVLHHLKDPSKGLKQLTEVLKSDGKLFLGLYSTLAREVIFQAREFVKEKGFSPTLDGIRQCRKAFFDLPNEDPLKEVISCGDFYTISSCRDLLFHVQETTFTLIEVRQLLERFNLRFLGFVHPSARISEAYREEFPEDLTQTSLDNWNIFESRHPKTFATMYQFYVSHR